MNKRRLTCLLHNVIVTPFIPFRLILFVFYKIGCLAEWLSYKTPGWRYYDGWSYGYKETTDA